MKTIIFILLFIAAFRLLMRFIGPYLIVYAAKRMQNQAFGGQQQSQQRRKPEGNISVDYVPPTKNQKTNTQNLESEFIDFTEIK